MNQQTKQIKNNIRYVQLGLIAITTITLTGCYVDVYSQYDGYGDTDVNHTREAKLSDFTSQFLADAALIPFALSMASPDMVANPDSYTTPRARSLSRALITETSYSYLWHNDHCALGGHNYTEAIADTTSYDDGYTSVDFTMEANAVHCVVENHGVAHTVNSDVLYQISGRYDDWEHRVSSIDGQIGGEVEVEYQLKYISHERMANRISLYSLDDYELSAESLVTIDDGFNSLTGSFETITPVHFYLGSQFPHQGVVRFSRFGQWSELSFGYEGFWRSDDDGWQRYYRWQDVYR